MPLRVPRHICTRPFSTTLQTRAAVPQFQYKPQLPSLPNPTPRVGRIAKWYLPTMAVLALTLASLPSTLFAPPPTQNRTVTLPAANSRIGFAIANALEHHNRQAYLTQQRLLEERNHQLLEAYGARNSLEDMERAFEMMSFGVADEGARRMGGGARDETERNRRLEEAYGGRTEIRELQRAMEIYEVQ
ncbi:uncharacterized protein EI97DRAFT_307183 [Westerdykella ornata]|uniref:Uncharacterized protein n=1 Tax=Westerdykella ornata TaxID=318751 RepID=A0A6A6JK62_WESOR|nr:uncharacterized protein EI97DRAFT_307183 [Westerdykella ornata]KAF2277040.1 hypothetical protein EI97DRAFT_307183 [Westerdykella ornata]